MAFEKYHDRTIRFEGNFKMAEWHTKIYSISIHEIFQNKKALETAANALPDMVKQAKASQLPTYGHSILIVHEAREGIWVLFSWWTGGEMLETVTFFIDFEEPTLLKPSPHPNFLICIWEMEVLIHERLAWIKHVLSHPDDPHFSDYLNDTL